jgi:hypothetical protein
MMRHLSIAVAAILFSGGCGEKGDPNAVVVAPTRAVKPEAAFVPAPRPQVDEGKPAEGQSPPPGQANDHSSPAFKGGGTPDKK